MCPRDPCSPEPVEHASCGSPRRPSRVDQGDLEKSLRFRNPSGFLWLNFAVCFTQCSSVQEEVLGAGGPGAGEDIRLGEEEIVGVWKLLHSPKLSQCLCSDQAAPQIQLERTSLGSLDRLTSHHHHNVSQYCM